MSGAALPAGFKLDAPSGSSLPEGFTLDAGPAPKANAVTDTTSALGYFDPRGPFEAATSMATGMAGQAIGGLAGLNEAVMAGPRAKLLRSLGFNASDPGEAPGAETVERVSSALTYEPKTKSGQTIMKGAEVLAAPVHWAAEKAGEQGEKVGPGTATAAKTLVEGLPVVLGARAAVAPKRPLSASQQKVADARDAGFKMTPQEMDAGVIPKNLASLSGEPRLAKLNSRENAALGTEKVKADLGIKPEAPLDLETLAQIRKDAGGAYETLRKAGEVAMDQKYLADLDALLAKYRSAAEDFPGAVKELGMQDAAKVVDSLKGKGADLQALRDQGIRITPEIEAQMATDAAFNANSAVDLVSLMRDRADAMFKSANAADKGMAKVYRGAAQALDDQLLRHLKATGQEGQHAAYIAARERIAKTYAAEKALVGEQVNPQALGKQVAQRKPLTGGLKETGEFARNFDRSAQKPTNMPTGATIHDIGLALVNGLRSSGGSLVLDAATAGLRPAVRHLLSSRMSQWAMDPRTNLSGPALEAVGASSSQPPPQRKSQ